MTKDRWFVVLVYADNICSAEPADSYDEAYEKGWAEFTNNSAVFGFHVTLSAGYWK